MKLIVCVASSVALLILSCLHVIRSTPFYPTNFETFQRSSRLNPHFRSTFLECPKRAYNWGSLPIFLNIRIFSFGGFTRSSYAVLPLTSAVLARKFISCVQIRYSFFFVGVYDSLANSYKLLQMQLVLIYIRRSCVSNPLDFSNVLQLIHLQLEIY